MEVDAFGLGGSGGGGGDSSPSPTIKIEPTFLPTSKENYGNTSEYGDYCVCGVICGVWWWWWWWWWWCVCVYYCITYSYLRCWF